MYLFHSIDKHVNSAAGLKGACSISDPRYALLDHFMPNISAIKANIWSSPMVNDKAPMCLPGEITEELLNMCKYWPYRWKTGMFSISMPNIAIFGPSRQKFGHPKEWHVVPGMHAILKCPRLSCRIHMFVNRVKQIHILCIFSPF